jgi:hypothetical protein
MQDLLRRYGRACFHIHWLTFFGWQSWSTSQLPHLKAHSAPIALSEIGGPGTSLSQLRADWATMLK